ncbi:CpaD family pilus assembly protein [Sphingomonas sp.]|uniref:CpaD family pilus assembly protein n=1 Tax=Sphingomonas sp. TaxID=28214 RepID=UPI00289795AD|nr:CpaD family pilus assembly protein [Sphingomonas sp.]
MRLSLSTLASAGLLALTAGCVGTGQPGLETVHQPVVTQADYALDLALSGPRLAGDEAQRFAGWADNLRLGYGDRVTIEDPLGEASVAYRQIAEIVGRHGLLVGTPAAIARAPLAPATIRVVVTRARASVPGCPDWSSDVAPDWAGRTASNHGCAVNRNLAAMVANPHDLVQGVDGPASADPAVAARAVNAFRRAQPTGNGGTLLRNATGKGGGDSGGMGAGMAGGSGGSGGGMGGQP